MGLSTARPASRRVAVSRLAILAALLIGAALVWWRYGPTDLATLRVLVQRVSAMREAAWVPPVFALAYAAAASFGLPITPLTLAAGVIFGSILGAVVSWAGAVAGAAGGYLLARRLGAGSVRALAGKRAYKIEALGESTSFLRLLRLQLIPVVPLSALNIACGIARVPLGTYIAAAAVGVIPGSAIYSYFGYRVIAGAANAQARSLRHAIIASVLLLILTFVPTLVGKVRGRDDEN
jgi:uncharacterized membrane protein YdjX (TVP38/TMEM64 family)